MKILKGKTFYKKNEFLDYRIHKLVESLTNPFISPYSFIFKDYVKKDFEIEIIVRYK